MLKKFFSSIMIVTLFMVNANAAAGNNLKAAFDDLNYALTVEWDQSDKAFYNQEMSKFGTVVKKLQAEGMTNQELINFTISQIKNEKIAKDLETAFNMISINKMSALEANAYVTKVLNQSYSQGASWSGAAIGGVIAVVVFVALAAILVGRAKVEDGCYQVYTCDTECWNGVCSEYCDYRCI